MVLRTIRLEDFSEEDLKRGDSFLSMAFLYEPILLEIKKRKLPLRELSLKIKEGIYETEEIFVGLFRLFGVSRLLEEKGGTFCLTAEDHLISFELSPLNQRISGFCRFKGEKWSFSTADPYISIESEKGEKTIRILPEGDGFRYRDLDRAESEKEGRLSLIAPPSKINFLLQQVRALRHG